MLTTRVAPRLVEGTPAQGSVFMGEDRPVPCVAFFLINLVEFDSDTARRWKGRKYSTLALEADGWTVEIFQLPDIHKRIDHLRSTGDFILTHSGTIKRVNGAPMTIAAAEKVQECLTVFLSFARGFFCAPVFLRGIAPTGEEVWKK